MPQVSPLASQKFGPSNRLSLEKDITMVRSLGNKIRVWPFLIHRLANGLLEPRLAITLTKKTGPAVQRNYVRRRVREFFRCLKSELGSFDYFFFSSINLEKISPGEWNKIFENLKKNLNVPLKNLPPPLTPPCGRGTSSEELATQVPLPQGGVRGGGRQFARVFRGVRNFISCWLIQKYQSTISPKLPTACRFHPTCSEYALGCYQQFGWWRASFYAGLRLLRCQPFCGGGLDPIPGGADNSLMKTKGY